MDAKLAFTSQTVQERVASNAKTEIVRNSITHALKDVSMLFGEILVILRATLLALTRHVMTSQGIVLMGVFKGVSGINVKRNAWKIVSTRHVTGRRAVVTLVTRNLKAICVAQLVNVHAFCYVLIS
jgi:hypothetical protein